MWVSTRSMIDTPTMMMKNSMGIQIMILAGTKKRKRPQLKLTLPLTLNAAFHASLGNHNPEYILSEYL